MEIIRQRLYNKRVTASRSATPSFSARSSTAGAALPRDVLPAEGRLVVGGSLLYRQFYELAVLGGTGLYNNAHGTLSSPARAFARPRPESFFRLVG